MPDVTAFFAFSLAIIAAISIGGSIGIMFSLREGKRRQIRRITTGQAELMTGFFIFSRFKYSLV